MDRSVWLTVVVILAMVAAAGCIGEDPPEVVSGQNSEFRLVAKSVYTINITAQGNYTIHLPAPVCISDASVFNNTYGDAVTHLSANGSFLIIAGNGDADLRFDDPGFWSRLATHAYPRRPGLNDTVQVYSSAADVSVKFCYDHDNITYMKDVGQDEFKYVSQLDYWYNFNSTLEIGMHAYPVEYGQIDSD